MRGALYFGGCVILGGITYLISNESTKKENKYFDLQTNNNTKTLQLFDALLTKSQVLSCELYSKSLPSITPYFTFNTTQTILSSSQKKIQIQSIVTKKWSEWWCKTSLMSLFAVVTHLGLVLNKKDGIWGNLNLQQILTAPTEHILELCPLIEEEIKKMNIGYDQTVNVEYITSVFKQLEHECLQKIISFSVNLMKSNIKTKDEEVVFGDMKIEEFLTTGFHCYVTALKNQILTLIQTQKTPLVMCQLVPKFNSYFKERQITPETFICNEMNQKLFEFFQ
ncbi:Transmembrane protein [Entamoeba marina]